MAQAKAAAGDKIVGVASPSIAHQCLNVGLLDGINVSVVPVLPRRGIRFFDNLEAGPVALDDPEIIESDGVTHLTTA